MEAPRIFYKYRSLVGENRIFVRDTLLNQQIYLADPGSLNDPFDCVPAFAPRFSPEGAYRLAMRAFARNKPRWSEEKLERAAKQFALETCEADMEILAQDLSDAYESVRRWLGIYCVSGTCQSALMWSHYADSHRGVCLGFSSDADVFTGAQPVVYSSMRPPVDPINDEAEEELSKSFLLKSQDWAYEKEWRVIDYEQGRGIRKLGEHVISEVIFGARISETDKRRVVDWIDQLEHKPQLFRASLSPTHFSIEICPFEG